MFHPSEKVRKCKWLDCLKSGPGPCGPRIVGPGPAALSKGWAGPLSAWPWPRVGLTLGQGQVRANPDPLIFSNKLIFFSKCSNIMYLLDRSVNSYLLMMKIVLFDTSLKKTEHKFGRF